MFTKECIVCGKVFKTNDVRKLICSEVCVNKKKNQYVKDKKTEELEQIRSERTCPHCGEIFIPEGRRNLTRTKFCSAKCRQNFKNKERWEKVKPPNPEPRPCAICSKTFTPSRKSPNAVTCSKECNIKRQQAMGKERRDKQRNEKLRQGKICAACGIRFFPNTHNQKFCSEKCRLEKKKEVQRKNAAAIPAEVKAERNKRCRWGGSWLKAMERDNNKCQLCGNEEKLNVHHLDGNGEKKNGKRVENDTSLDNLITLCEQCHKDMHGIFIIKIADGWGVRGNAFKKLGLSGTIKILDIEN